MKRALVGLGVVILVAGTVVVRASSDSLPGEPLYRVKQVSRVLHLGLLDFALQFRAVAELKERIQDEEFEEVRLAAEQGRSFEAEVSGVITDLDWWNSLTLNDTLYVNLSPTTVVGSHPRVGSLYQVRVRSEGGRLFAERIACYGRCGGPPRILPMPTGEIVYTRPVTPCVGCIVPANAFTGSIESINGDVWIVDGKRVRVSHAIITGKPLVGRTARVQTNNLVETASPETFDARGIEVFGAPYPPPYPEPTPTSAGRWILEGVVELRESETIWIVNGTRVRLDHRTEISGRVEVGAFVKVVGLMESPTSLYALKVDSDRYSPYPEPFYRSPTPRSAYP